MTLDVMSNSPFFTTKYKLIWKENPVVNQKSLRAFFHAPLQISVNEFISPLLMEMLGRLSLLASPWPYGLKCY